MLIGIVGAPNKGKSTLFSAMTLIEVDIADYPFTTIKPNIGVGYVARKCVEQELGVKCKPRNSLCINGIRRIPVNLVDVAGLVPGAHLGKGMGNQFLNDLINADVLIQVVDLSGKTDVNGSVSESSDPALEVEMIKEEMSSWLAGIIMKHKSTFARRNDGDVALSELLSGFRCDIAQIRDAAAANALSASKINWSEDEAKRFAASLLAVNKPIIIAANKMDQSPKDALAKLKTRMQGHIVVGCSAAVELALRKAAKAGIIDYEPGSDSFALKGQPGIGQKNALDFMAKYIKENRGTGVEQLLDAAVFTLLKKIVVYPVEDENKYTDHFGNVLPDARLIGDGATATDLAASIHTDLARHMLHAVDAKRKIRIAKDYKLKDNDVIKIVSSAK